MSLADLLSDILPGRLAFAIVALVLLVVAVVLLILWRTTATRLGRAQDDATRARAAAAELARPPAAPPAAAAAVVPTFDVGLAQRVIDLADLAASPAVEAQAQRVLMHLGIHPLAAQPGDAFDEEIHMSAGTEPTDDTAQAGKIASIVRPGWEHDGLVIRPADVTVWAGRW